MLKWRKNKYINEANLSNLIDMNKELPLFSKGKHSIIS